MRVYRLNGKTISKAASEIVKRQYQFKPLSALDKLQHELALAGELEIQKWYNLAYSTNLHEEITICIQ